MYIVALATTPYLNGNTSIYNKILVFLPVEDGSKSLIYYKYMVLIQLLLIFIASHPGPRALVIYMFI